MPHVPFPVSGIPFFGMGKNDSNVGNTFLLIWDFNSFEWIILSLLIENRCLSILSHVLYAREMVSFE